MTAWRERACDPQQLAERFAAPEADDSTPLDVDHDQYARMLALLPKDEVDALELLGRGVTQRAVGSLFGVSSVAVYYRKRRAIERLRWLQDTGYLDVDQVLMRVELARVLKSHQLTVVCEVMASTTIETSTARRLGISGNKAHRWFHGALERVTGAGPRYALYARVLRAIAERPGMLNRPAWHVECERLDQPVPQLVLSL